MNLNLKKMTLMTGFVVQVDLVLRKLFFSMYLLSMLKIVVLLNIFVETLIYTFQDYLMKKNSISLKEKNFVILSTSSLLINLTRSF